MCRAQTGSHAIEVRKAPCAASCGAAPSVPERGMSMSVGERPKSGRRYAIESIAPSPPLLRQEAARDPQRKQSADETRAVGQQMHRLEAQTEAPSIAGSLIGQIEAQHVVQVPGIAQALLLG